MTPLEKMGTDVASALPPALGAHRRARQRAALLAVDWERRRRIRRAVWLVPLVPLAAAAMVIALLWFKAGSIGTDVTEMSGDVALGEGRWLRVSDDARARLQFADGTKLELDRNSTSRLARPSTSEARLTLENGALRAWVEPAQMTGRSWTFEAGPYAVHIVGTELSVAWSSENSRLSVDVVHGRVHVRGGQLEREGVLLGPGDHLEVDTKAVELRRANASAARAATGSSKMPPALEAVPVIASSAVETNSTASTKANQNDAPTSGDEWKSLARGGNYEEALRAAEREGFDDLMGRVPAADLALLADAARLSGDSGKARRALLTLRRRFPGVDAASMAAFRLGRLALADRDYGEAAQWFRAYLADAPSGTLANEALGRLIEAQTRAGDRFGAEASARDYLRRFPGGPYESLARGVVRGDKLAPQER